MQQDGAMIPTAGENSIALMVADDQRYEKHSTNSNNSVLLHDRVSQLLFWVGDRLFHDQSQARILRRRRTVQEKGAVVYNLTVLLTS